MHQYAKGDHGTGMETAGFGGDLSAGFRMSTVCCWWGMMKKKYYFNDPYDNNGVIGYERELVEKRHAAQHSMAIGTVTSTDIKSELYKNFI